MKKVLIVPDTHIPYHDKKAWDLLLKAGKQFKPDIIVSLGDFADFYSVSSHLKDPKRKSDLSWEVEQVNAALDQLDSLGAKGKFFISGNHEDRLERYLKSEAPELFSMFTVAELFKLKKRRWEFIPYKNSFRLGKIHFTHDTGTAGARAHLDAQRDFQDNIIIGHTHRMHYSVVGNAKGVPHIAAMFGWLGDAKSVDYMHKIKIMRDWALGFGVGYLLPNGNMHIIPVPLVDYTCVIDGKLVK